MAIRKTVVPNASHSGHSFPDSALAHQLLDTLQGIEIGASDHNSFHLPGCINVANEDQIEFYRNSQIVMNGCYVEIDVFDDGETLATFADGSQDYIISSHMFEHLANPIKALLRWVQVIKAGGYIFMIVPQRDAAPGDVGRELSTYAEWYQAYTEGWTPETAPEERTRAAGGPRGHYFVYSATSLMNLISSVCQDLGMRLEIVSIEDPDKKAGNGFTLVYKVLEQVVLLIPVGGEGISASGSLRAPTDYELHPAILNEDGSIASTPLNISRTMPNGDPIVLTADGYKAIPLSDFHDQDRVDTVVTESVAPKKRKTKAAK